MPLINSAKYTIDYEMYKEMEEGQNTMLDGLEK